MIRLYFVPLQIQIENEQLSKTKLETKETIYNHTCTRRQNLTGKKKANFWSCAEKERCIVFVWALMSCSSKERGPIEVLSHDSWIRDECYFFSRCNTRALLLYIILKGESLLSSPYPLIALNYKIDGWDFKKGIDP